MKDNMSKEVENFNPRTHRYDWDLDLIVELTHEEKQEWVYADERYRKEEERLKKVVELRKTLTSYSEDIIQAAAGVYIADIEERKRLFIETHNELRQLEGKTPRSTR